jgi:predicted TIM-barrel fold metal-dependent hydrolase
MIDAHHHLWDLSAVNYPWLMAKGVPRFFGDPAPIQRDYLLPEFTSDAQEMGISGSVHIQVGAQDPMEEAIWVQKLATLNPDWPLAQVVFCDLTAPDIEEQLDVYKSMPSVRGVRQIVGRAPGEDAVTGTNTLLDDPNFVVGLQAAGARGLSFDLQLIPELYERTAEILAQAPKTRVALCHAGSPHDRSQKGLQEWCRKLVCLSDQPQISCKLSGLGMFDHKWTQASIAPIVENCFDQFGPKRLMFGSNFPVDSLYSDYKTLFEALWTLTPTEFHKLVFKSNAAEFYSFLK